MEDMLLVWGILGAALAIWIICIPRDEFCKGGKWILLILVVIASVACFGSYFSII